MKTYRALIVTAHPNRRDKKRSLVARDEDVREIQTEQVDENSAALFFEAAAQVQQGKALRGSLVVAVMLDGGETWQERQGA